MYIICTNCFAKIVIPEKTKEGTAQCRFCKEKVDYRTNFGKITYFRFHHEKTNVSF